MALERTAKLIAERKPVTVVAYGDSISSVGFTPGYFGGAKSPEANWASRLGDLLREAWPRIEFHVRHFGIGGQNAYEGLGRFHWLAPLKPDLVLIEFGANDCGYHFLIPEETALALRTLVDAIRNEHKADVVLLGRGGDNPRRSKMVHFAETAEAVRKVAEEKKAPWADIRGAILRVTRDGEAWEEYHNGKEDCHPNDRGHAVWAEAVMRVLLDQIPCR